MKQITAPRGTHDVLPSDSFKWRFVESKAFKAATSAGYKEIRFPTFEDTDLFARGVGDSTDIVQKEMYTFTDKGDRSVTLRPEGTASAVRLALEHGLLNEALPLKAFYRISAFRYEKPQAGRYREFSQFGMELFGAQSPAADAELISVGYSFLTGLGINGISVKINSIGCPVCRANYQKSLREYFSSRSDELCDTCRSRLERNPMRILDCKSPVCKEICDGAPVITDFICDECREHYESLKEILTGLGIPYIEDPGIVRGLDYYTKTVFEIIQNSTGLAILAGGRYDGLVEELGGKHVPAVGFASGLERIVSLMESEGLSFGEDSTADIYIAPLGNNASVFSSVLASDLRKHGLNSETDLIGRSLKAQMKYADKIGARYVIVVGDDEISSGKAVLRKMEDGSSSDIPLTASDIAIQICK